MLVRHHQRRRQHCVCQTSKPPSSARCRPSYRHNYLSRYLSTAPTRPSLWHRPDRLADGESDWQSINAFVSALNSYARTLQRTADGVLLMPPDIDHLASSAAIESTSVAAPLPMARAATLIDWLTSVHVVCCCRLEGQGPRADTHQAESHQGSQTARRLELQLRHQRDVQGQRMMPRGRGRGRWGWGFLVAVAVAVHTHSIRQAHTHTRDYIA